MTKWHIDFKWATYFWFYLWASFEMHHFSNLSTAPLLCVCILSCPCVGKTAVGACSCPVWPLQWGDADKRCRRWLGECLQLQGGDPCLPVISLLSQCWCPSIWSPIFDTLPARADCIELQGAEHEPKEHGWQRHLIINSRPAGSAGKHESRGYELRQQEPDWQPSAARIVYGWGRCLSMRYQ